MDVSQRIQTQMQAVGLVSGAGLSVSAVVKVCQVASFLVFLSFCQVGPWFFFPYPTSLDYVSYRGIQCLNSFWIAIEPRVLCSENILNDWVSKLWIQQTTGSQEFSWFSSPILSSVHILYFCVIYKPNYVWWETSSSPILMVVVW